MFLKRVSLPFFFLHDSFKLQESAESLLRSALQGKGYTKGIQLQNCIAIIPGGNTKNELLNGDNQVSRPTNAFEICSPSITQY